MGKAIARKTNVLAQRWTNVLARAHCAGTVQSDWSAHARVPGYIIQLSRVYSPRPPLSLSLSLGVSSHLVHTCKRFTSCLVHLRWPRLLPFLVLGAYFPPLAPFPCFRAPPQALVGQVS